MHKSSARHRAGSSIVRRNFAANLGDGAFFAFGMSFVSITTVLPLMIRKLGGGNIAVGLVPVVWTLGFNLPQILMAGKVRRISRKKPLLLKTAFFQRIMWLILGGIVFFLFGRVNPKTSLVFFFIGFALAAVAGSLNLPGWFDLVAKLTPQGVRGRLFALRSMSGGFLGLLGGWSVRRTLDRRPFPENFGILFLFAFVFMMISYVFLILLREDRPSPIEPEEVGDSFGGRLLRIVRGEKNFRRFLVADALLQASLMADAFYAVHAFSRFSLTGGYAGTFTMILMVSLIAGNVLFGGLADRFGHRMNLRMAALFTVAACAVALTARNVVVYSAVFVGSAFTTGLIQVSRLAIISEICREKGRPTHIALDNLLASPFILTALLGGWMADRLGYWAVFTAAGILALGSALWISWKVEEPRRLKSISLREAP